PFQAAFHGGAAPADLDEQGERRQRGLRRGADAGAEAGGDFLGLVPVAGGVVDEEAEEAQLGAVGAPVEAGLVGEADAGVGDDGGLGHEALVVVDAGVVEVGAQVHGEVAAVAAGGGEPDQVVGLGQAVVDLGVEGEGELGAGLGVLGAGGAGGVEGAPAELFDLGVARGPHEGAGERGQGPGQRDLAGRGLDGVFGGGVGGRVVAELGEVVGEAFAHLGGRGQGAQGGDGALVVAAVGGGDGAAEGERIAGLAGQVGGAGDAVPQAERAVVVAVGLGGGAEAFGLAPGFGGGGQRAGQVVAGEVVVGQLGGRGEQAGEG